MEINITSEFGQIGRLVWTNSKPAPYFSLLRQRLSTYWGGVAFDPDPRCWVGEEAPLTQ